MTTPADAPRYAIRPAKSNPEGRLDAPYAVTRRGVYFRTFPSRDAAEADAYERNDLHDRRARAKAENPHTGPCGCRRGIWRDNCAACEATGWRIDFAALRARHATKREG